MELSKSTSAIVGIWDSKGNAYVRGYGDESVHADTKIRAAQASQPAMCALLLDLVQDGKVSLDREVSKDLTRQVGLEGVTYRHLCTMQSGIADYKTDIKSIFANNPTRFWPEQELIAQGLADSPLSWPGLDVHQSDTNAVILARALRVLTRDDISTLLADRVFDKAGMDSSTYPALDSLTVGGSPLPATAFPVQGGSPVCDAGPNALPEVSPSMLSGAGATVTTVTDLKRLYEHYFDGTFGGKDAGVVKELLPVKNPARNEQGEPTEELDTAGNQWAFGMEKVGPMYGRSGAITGTLTSSYRDPDTGFTVVVSLNNSSAGMSFVRAFAFELTAIAAGAGAGPEVSWSAESQLEAMTKSAVCQG